MRLTPIRQIILTRAPEIIIGMGIILRVREYLANRSFTEGEAALAMNIIQRSYEGLTEPLAYVQAAPVGFLFLQKSMVNFLGNSEYTLRLFPLIAGIISLILFYRIAQRLLTGWAIPIALILFATGEHLIYFSAEIKQYSSDVAIALLLYLLAFDILEKKTASKKNAYLGLLAAVALWFSHPSLFVYGAITIVFGIIFVRNRQWDNLRALVFASLLWGISLLGNYLISLAALMHHKEFLDYWSPSFMPLLIKSWMDIRWFVYNFLRIFKNPLGLGIYGLLFSALCFVTGCRVFFCKSKKRFTLLILPLLLALLASGFRKYPFEGRLLLFTVPAMLLIIATGIEYIRSKLPSGSCLIACSLVITLLIYPMGLAFYHFVKPRQTEELRPVLSYLKNHYQEGDIIYLYYAARNAFQYYSDKFGFDKINYLVGTELKNDWRDYYFDLVQLKGHKRVWIIFSHIVTWQGVDEEKLFLSYLNLLGRKFDCFKAPGAAAYLYDLSALSDIKP